MTQFHKEPVTCPFCTSDEDTVIWDVIDVEADPDLKDRLLKKQIQVLSCLNCGEESILALPLLYVDRPASLVYYYCPQYKDLLETRSGSGEGRKGADTILPAELERELDEAFARGWSDFQLRLVPDYNGLIEKIHISDSGLDDRLMEVIKLALRTRYLDEEGIRFEEMHFLSADENLLLFNVMEKETGWYSLEIFREIYDSAAEALAGLLPSEGRWQLINQDYAAWLITRG